jgi:hypothetical protein
MSQSLKNFLASTETATNISSVGLSYDLDDNQVSKVAGTLRELILGKIFIKDFPVTISSKLGIDDVKAGEIVNKLVSQSFGPIIEDVKRIQRSSFPDKVTAMQKEIQPTGLNQPTARPDSPQAARPDISQQAKPSAPTIPEEIKNVPLTQPGVPIQSGQSPATESRILDMIGTRPDVQSVRPPSIPPLVQQSKPEPIPNPPAQLTPKPTGQSMPPAQEARLSPRLSESGAGAPQERQFKMPDLGPINATPGQQQSTAKEGQPGQGQNAQKSLEEELEKVAGVIDLRAKQGE